MKSSNLKFLFCSVVTILTLTGCEDPSSQSQVEETKYQIVFNTFGGSKVDTIEAEAATKVSAPTNPTKNGYEFLGWYTDETYSTKYQFSKMPAKNIEVFAKWSLNNYYVTYNTGLGQNNGQNPTMYNVTQNNFSLGDPSWAGKYFAGWYTEETYENQVTAIDTSLAADITLYAKWSDTELVDDYTITYHLDGGTNGVNNPATFNKLKDDITLEVPTREGFEFGGWYTDNSFQTSIATIDTELQKNIDVYAKWTVPAPVVPSWQINYKNMLNASNNSGNPVRYKEADGTITLQEPSKGSCTFQGWYADAEFTTPITSIDCSLKTNVDVYAKWLDGITINNLEFDFGLGTEFTFFHASDLHTNAGTSNADKKAENSWINDSRYSFAKSFGERYTKENLYQSSTENFTAIREYMNSQNPDAICYTGDLMDFYSVANYNFIYNELSDDKNTVPFVYAIGNHEDPSSNYVGMPGTNPDGTGFYVIEFDNVQIVCFDNSFNDGSGAEDVHYSYTDEQYTLFKNLLDTTTKPIIVAQHVPILNDYNCSSRLEACGGHFFIDYGNCPKSSKDIIDLICNDPQVLMVVCGHIHGGVICNIAPGKPEVISTSGLIGVINKITIK